MSSSRHEWDQWNQPQQWSRYDKYGIEGREAPSGYYVTEYRDGQRAYPEEYDYNDRYNYRRRDSHRDHCGQCEQCGYDYLGDRMKSSAYERERY